MANRTRLLSILSVALLVCCYAAAAKAPAPERRQPADSGRLFLWKVASSEGAAYLLGSLHLAKPEIYPLPAEIMKAFDDSSTLVVELDESKIDPAAMTQLMLVNGIYQPNDSLIAHLSAQTKEALNAYLGGNSQLLLIFNKLKPWAAAINITLMELQKQGFDPRQGIDKYFIAQAKAKGKPVEELESADFQIKLLSGFSDELQDAFLLSALVDAPKMNQDFQRMLSAWLTGNSEQMNDVLTETLQSHPELAPLYDELFFKRNVTMTDKVQKYLKQKGSYFVVVGAGHLVGEKGMVKLLEDRGYKVEQVTRQATTASTPEGETPGAAPPDSSPEPAVQPAASSTPANPAKPAAPYPAAPAAPYPDAPAPPYPDAAAPAYPDAPAPAYPDAPAPAAPAKPAPGVN